MRKLTDVARALDVRAAAQLDREAGHVDDAHLGVVLLAEQRHGAGGVRLVQARGRS
jgi:hypothetical protein